MANNDQASMRVELFAEDRAHEAFLVALLERIACEEQLEVNVRLRSVRGGHGRALTELDLYQRMVRTLDEPPELIVVCIDGNCLGTVEARNQISARIDAAFADRVVIASPNPHVERWYMADPASFHRVVGQHAVLGKRKCERGLYKKRLADAVRNAGHPATLGGVEFAKELVDAMDFYRAGRNETSLAHCVGKIRDHIQRR
jgi:hypothetical protein